MGSLLPWRRVAVLACIFLACALGDAQEIPKEKLDQLYQNAVSAYESGRYAEAAEQLEKVLPYSRTSFEVHELMGMVYASNGQNAKAEDHLKLAVQLRPNSAEARTNFAAALMHSGKTALAGEQFRKALELEPQSYGPNHNLGEFYVQTGKMAEAQPLLAQAHKIDPSAYDNGYDLAMAYFLLGKNGEARTVIQDLLKRKETGELHNLLGQIDEKDGNYLDAAKDYEMAAHLEPSEDNLFDWGSEMLLHRTYEPAIEIFQQGTQRYPKSARLLIGLGLSLYSRGKYDDAVKALMAAADLDPADQRAYVFLSKAYDSSPNQADDVIQRFRRFAELQPNNALAQYYYAMSLWKGRRAQDASLDVRTIQGLLEKAIAKDDNLADAHVQLGNLLADQHNYEQSIPHYVRALQLDANLADAHYRLGTDYVRVGRKDDAQKEFATYQKLRAEHLAEVEKERAEVQQFVYSEKNPGVSKP